jgi:hypothetical protein
MCRNESNDNHSEPDNRTNETVLFFLSLLREFETQFGITFPISENVSEGYIVGRLIGEIMKVYSNSQFTREQFMKTIYETQTFDIDGLKLGPYQNTPTQKYNVGLDTIYLIKYNPTTKEYEQIDKRSVPVC